jgi:hypothetical protein
MIFTARTAVSVKLLSISLEAFSDKQLIISILNSTRLQDNLAVVSSSLNICRLGYVN